ncbi:MAG: glutaredoxin 3 [Neisseriales bacterium]|nr:MAG: glutaredoxin 3 [Neisseriales bacterium]
MSNIVLYTTLACPYCKMAKQLLASKKSVTIQEIRIDLETQQKMEMIRLTGQRTVPQIFVNGTHIGGYDDLCALNQTGKLDTLLIDKEGSSWPQR